MVVMASIMVEKGVVVDAIIVRPTAVENENNDLITFFHQISSQDLILGVTASRCMQSKSRSDRVPGGSQR